MPDHVSLDTPALATPPPDEARAQLHAWLDACDETVLLALWRFVRAWLGGSRQRQA
jgi:hypothetical protein